jgi:hypothetical protein
MHLRGVRDEEVAGSNPVTPTLFGLVRAHFDRGAGVITGA